MKNIQKYWWAIIFVLGLLSSAAVYIRSEAIKEEKLKQVVFPSQEMKAAVVARELSQPTIKQEMYTRILDSINKTKAIKSRRLRDSLQIVASNRDSLTAQTIYEMKEEMASQRLQLKRAIRDRNN